MSVASSTSVQTNDMSICFCNCGAWAWVFKLNLVTPACSVIGVVNVSVPYGTLDIRHWIKAGRGIPRIYINGSTLCRS